jgi:hypothetical protein
MNCGFGIVLAKVEQEERPHSASGSRRAMGHGLGDEAS